MEPKEKIVLTDIEPPMSINSDVLAQTIVARIGLFPRKKGSTESMHRTLIEFYERAKKATAQKDPKVAVMTVEEMAIYAKISRQTMYEYLQRWLLLGIITKVSFIDSSNKVIVGYKLNGTTLEDAFKNVKANIEKNLEKTQNYVTELQKLLKNEKIANTLKKDREEVVETESEQALSSENEESDPKND